MRSNSSSSCSLPLLSLRPLRSLRSESSFIIISLVSLFLLKLKTTAIVLYCFCQKAIRGVHRNLKWGEGRNLKPFVFRPKSSEEQKKRSTRPQMSNFPAQSLVKSKKRSSRPQIVLYSYITFTPQPPPPPWIRPWLCK